VQEQFMSSVIVIGGGISGLATARWIADHHPNAQLTILEASERLGGCIRTAQQGGFVCELGPSGFLNKHPSTIALAERVGLGGQIVTGCERMRRRFILSRGRLRRFPDSPQTFLTSDLLSLRARVRLMMEPVIPCLPQRGEETVAQFARRRLGKEAAELLVDPVISGIYAGDPNRLSVQATLPELAGMEGNGRSLLQAFTQSRQQHASESSASPSAVGRRRYVSFQGGLGQLIDALAGSMSPEVVRHDSPVEAVHRDGTQWRVLVGGDAPSELSADVVVSAAPAPAANGYLGHLHDDLAAVCSTVPYAPVAMVALGYREADIPHPLDGFGYLVPSVEGGSVLGVLWSSSIFPGHRCSSGQVLIQAVLGGVRDRTVCDQDDETLLRTARVQLRRTIGVASKPLFSRIHRHRGGIPQYEIGHLRRVARAEAALLNYPGLFLTGNAFRGIGINACTADGARVGSAAVSYLDALGSKQTVSYTRASL
jgi:oxygen-dependent protoporphyrinogen oxidase